MELNRRGVALAVAVAASTGLLANRPAHAEPQPFGYDGAEDQSPPEDQGPALAENDDGMTIPNVAVPAGFEDALSPYGQWLDVPTWGWVWRPGIGVVGSNFRPYATAGHWSSSPEGWVFESDYPWGAIPFHYGRWLFDHTYGWMWLPGTAWGPSWVDWRSGAGNIGWAPMPPPGLVASEQAYEPWSFVALENLTAPQLAPFLIIGPKVRSIFAGTTVYRNRVVVNGAHWEAGPRATLFEAAGLHPASGPSRKPAQLRVEKRVAPVRVGPRMRTTPARR